eukprot:gb/GEZN01003450.1/.p1 GENE.gb/GEZN01003450.1/~~gb/GEZN01003450.1/.p1  ORF type:complete len:653 (+),score=165.23 gb/GEZN01003450.1/:73-2031(+)
MAMKLNVRRGNTVFEVKRKRGLTVADVKKLIQERERIPPDQQHLLFEAMELTEDQDVSVFKQGELHLVTRQDLSSCLDPAWNGGDPAWEKSVRLALRLEQEEKASFQDTTEPDLGHASLLLAQRMQWEEETKDKETKRAEELSLQLIYKLLSDEQQETWTTIKAKQQEQQPELIYKLLNDEQQETQTATKAKQQELQPERDEEGEEHLRAWEELRKKVREQKANAKQQEEEHSRAWQELQRKQQFELDKVDEKLRVEEDKKGFYQTQVARNRNEEAKEAAKEELLSRKEEIDKNVSKQLDTASALNARSQQAERKLTLARQQQAQEQAKQQQVRAAVRAEVARQEAARLAALRARPDPNLYLYPPAADGQQGYMDATVQIKLAPFWVLSFVEPEVTSGGVNSHSATWKVEVNSKGKLRDQNGQARRFIKYDMLTLDADALLQGFALRSSNTFCVSVRDYQAFFERALRKLGLEGQEIRDMVAFCGPMMKVSEWTNVTFVSTSIYDKMVNLSIDPAPQQLIRVFAVLRNVPGWDATANATLDSLTTPPLRDPSKFVAVEWGAANASRWDAISSIKRAEVQEAEEAEHMRVLAEQNAQATQYLHVLRSQNALSVQSVRSQEVEVRRQEEGLRAMRQAHANERSQFRNQGLYFSH